MTIQDVFAAIAVLFNGIPMMIFAMSYGFLAAPTAFGFMVGAGGMLLFSSILPISIQAGTIALIGQMGSNLKERLSIALFSGIVMAILGAFGVLHDVMDFAGVTIIRAMMAGVGIILARVGINMLKSNAFTGGVSLVVALAVWAGTRNLVYVIGYSVVISAAAHYLKYRKPIEVESQKFQISLHKPMINVAVIRGTLALACLTIGSNIAFGNITAGMARVTPNIDHLTVYSGIANVAAALFGGAPAEAIISATGAAPNPMAAGILLMVFMTIVLLSGLLPKIARYVPMQSIAGFLFVIGAIVTVPSNAALAFGAATGSEVLVSGITLTVTALTDPFLGLVAGLLMRGAAALFGF